MKGITGADGLPALGVQGKAAFGPDDGRSDQGYRVHGSGCQAIVERVRSTGTRITKGGTT